METPLWRSAAALGVAALLAACAQAPLRSSLVPTAAGQVEVLAEGKGPLVVLLSSAARGAHDFDQVRAMLAARGFRVVSPEPRGSGRTTGPHAGISLHEVAADVAAVIRHEKQGPAIVVGHAAGSFVARMLAVDHPELVRGVVLAAAGARSFPPIPALRLLDQDKLSDADRIPLLRAAYFAPGNDPSAWLDGWRPLLRFDGAGGAPGLASREEWWGAGDKPVLELQPLDDPFKPAATRGEYRAEFGARVSVEEIAHASHALFPEQPAAVVDAIAGWARALPVALPSGKQAAPGTVFQDCAECPQMTVLPAGEFTMGSSDGGQGQAAGEGPPHRVTLVRPFAVARFALSRAQFGVFARAVGLASSGACDRDAPGYPQNAAHPAVCMSWDEARGYAAWLSTRTGQRYRLLSEAEYEYAARAGGTARFWWGDDPAAACTAANLADRTSAAAHPGQKDAADCDDGAAETAAIGRYRPNAFGLYDMAGNTWSWTADCWSDSYGGAPADGMPRRDGDCGKRVARGGSWAFGLRAARVSMRGKLPASARTPDQGLRIAREL
jgi:formylglycine-generating enzyme required for sulfatase activity